MLSRHLRSRVSHLASTYAGNICHRERARIIIGFYTFQKCIVDLFGYHPGCDRTLD